VLWQKIVRIILQANNLAQLQVITKHLLFDRDPNVKINMAAKIQDGNQTDCQLFLTSENHFFQWVLILILNDVKRNDI